MPRPTKTEIEERMRKGEVPGISIAYLDSKKAIPIEPVVGSLTPVIQWLSLREGLVFAEDRVSHDAQLTTMLKTTGQYKDKMQEIRKSEPGYMAPTESSGAKEREKYSPFQTTLKPPWEL